MKIAVAGKGGVGKTFISGTLACMSARLGKKTIAIDADTAPNLALTLGLTPDEASRILPIAENTPLIEEKTKTDYPGVYRLTFTVDDIIAKYAVPTPCGVRLLVMGTVRTPGTGCACAANSFVRVLLTHLLVQKDEVIILDMEAGIEHLGRGTANQVDLMLVVTDAHQASLITAGKIADLAIKGKIPHVAFIGNRIMDDENQTLIQEMADQCGVKVISFIPFDPNILSSGVKGLTPVNEYGFPSVKVIHTLANSFFNQ